MAKSETPARDALLVKYLNEAYGKEKQLETALNAQIARSQRPPIVKGLKDHLNITKRQARELQSRIKALGGKADAGPTLPGPDLAADAAGAVTSLANKAVAAAKGPMQMLRGTSEADNEIRNLRDCYWNEAEEIAHYAVIERLANEVGDKETARMAKTFRKEEERMQALIERQLAPLLKEVIRQEIPAAERRSNGGRRRSTSSSRSTSRSSSSRSTSSSSRSTTSRARSTAKSAAKTARAGAKAASTGAKAGATSARRSAAGSKGGSKRGGSTTAKTVRAGAKAARTGAKAGATSARRSAAGSRGGSKRS